MTDSNTDSSDDEDRRSTEDVYREIHDWTSADSLSSTLLTALADVKDVAPTDLEPLYETLDPEALDNLFGSDGDGFRADGHVSFPVAGCDVSIYSHGEFAVISIKKSPESVDFGGGVANSDDTASFKSSLQELVRTAAQNGVPVEGGWVVRPVSPEFPELEVQITKVVRRSD